MKAFHVLWHVPENVFHEILWKKSFTVLHPCLNKRNIYIWTLSITSLSRPFLFHHLGLYKSDKTMVTPQKELKNAKYCKTCIRKNFDEIGKKTGKRRSLKKSIGNTANQTNTRSTAAAVLPTPTFGQVWESCSQFFQKLNSTLENNVRHFGVLHWQQWQPPASAPEYNTLKSSFDKSRVIQLS